MSFEVTRIMPSVSPLEGYRPGTPDVAEAVGVSREALRWLGLDPSTEELQGDFEDVAALGFAGRLYPEIGQDPKTGQSYVPFEALLAAAEGQRPKDDAGNFTVEKVDRYPKLWVPGTDEGGYTVADLDRGPGPSEGRIALFNATATDYDPLLHGLWRPYDEAYAKPNEETQLDFIARRRETFQAHYPNRTFGAVGVKACLMMALMDRIRGQKPEEPNYVNPFSQEFVLNRGFMRIPDLGRRALIGVSVVGYVASVDSQLGLGGAGGNADPSIGVGLAAGPETPQDA